MERTLRYLIPISTISKVSVRIIIVAVTDSEIIKVPKYSETINRKLTASEYLTINLKIKGNGNHKTGTSKREDVHVTSVTHKRFEYFLPLSKYIFP